MADRLDEIKAKRKGRDAKYYGGFGWDIDDIDWLIARVEELERLHKRLHGRRRDPQDEGNQR
jgi:hypothetical protein